MLHEPPLEITLNPKSLILKPNTLSHFTWTCTLNPKSLKRRHVRTLVGPLHMPYSRGHVPHPDVV